jgi:hypothetical protein
MSRTSQTFLVRYGSASRRLLAVFCAFAFLFVGITHTFSHYDTVTITFELQVGDGSDDGTDSSKSTAVHHCCGYTGAALTANCVLAVSELAGTKLTFPPIAHVRAHDPTFATPPPKS